MDRFFGLDTPSMKDEDLEHLATANDRVYLAIISGLLEEAEIPFLVKERGSAMNIIAGYSFFGSDIYVHRENFEEAIVLLNAFDEANPEETEEAVDSEESEEEEDL